jgi:TetR/AcrR family transcriptional regulator, cholesterol catabolism regulator
VTKRNRTSNVTVTDRKVPTSDRVLRTGAQLFREQTYALSTTRELSARLGINKASLYYHVSSKEELLYLICVNSLQRVTEAINKAIEPHGDPRARLHAAFHAQLCSVLGDLDLHATMLLELLSLRDQRRADVVRMRDEFEGLIVDLIADAQQASDLRTDIQAKHLAYGMLSLLNWTISWYSPEGPLSANELAEILWQLFINGAADPSHTAPSAFRPLTARVDEAK